MKKRLLSRYAIHRHDPIRVEVAGNSFRIFPLTDSRGQPHMFLRSMKEARDFCATEQIPNILWQISRMCGEDEDPYVQIRKISDLCHQLTSELHISRRSQSFAMTEKTVHQVQEEAEHEEREYCRAFRKGLV
jgi:hypothetical protein